MMSAKTFTPVSLCAVLVLLWAPPSLAREIVSNPPATELAPLVEFQFVPGNHLMVQGNGTEKGSASSCRGQFPSSEVIGSFTAGAVFHQNACYTDGRYNHRNYRFTVGELRASDGSVFEAIQVDEPLHKAEKFLASHHHLFFMPAEEADYHVYRYDRGTLQPVGKMGREENHPGTFRRVPGADLSAVSGSAIFVIVETRPLTAYHVLNDHTEGALVRATPWGPQEKRRIRVAGRPFDTAGDYTAGPSDHANTYGIHRQFFFLASSGSILYQDKSSGKIQLVSLDGQLLYRSEKTLIPSAKELLAAAADDPEGNIYLMRISLGRGESRSVRIQKFSPDGRLLKEKQYDSSKSGLNLYAYSENLSTSSAVSSMAVSQNTVAVVLSRTMHKSGDGLNHQGAIAFTVDAQDLALVKNLGQTSGHSFGNFIYPDENGFIAVDLGDNYPRGVHLHRITRDKKIGRIVFTFKTQHGSSTKSPAGRDYPEYTEISTPAKRFYRWSNDNRTYTEIGGIAPAEKGYMVLFSTELPSLQNARTGNNLNDPRNLAVVYVRRDFDSIAQKGNYVVDEMMLLRSSPTEGRFYDFGGRLNEQRNTGVKDLTSFKSTDQNVSRPKLLRVGPNRNLALYEIWNPTSYKTTEILEFDDNGTVVRKLELGPVWRLNRQDDVYLYRGRLISLAGSAADQTIEINSISISQ